MTTSTARAYAASGIPTWTFADKIRKARETTGLGQIEFAREVGLTASTLGAYEKGRTHPRFGDVAALARRVQMRTGIPYEWFLVEDEPAPAGPEAPNRGAEDYRVDAPVVSLDTFRAARTA